MPDQPNEELEKVTAEISRLVAILENQFSSATTYTEKRRLKIGLTDIRKDLEKFEALPTEQPSNEEDPNGKEKETSTVSAINVKLARAYNIRGLASYYLKAYDLTLQDCAKALELNPNEAGAYAGKGAALFNREEYQQAIVELDRAIELDPELADAYLNQGLAFYALKEYQKALENYSQIIKLGDELSLSTAYSSRAITYYVLEDYQHAIEDANRAIELEPDFADACYIRGLIFYKQEQYQQAISELSRFIEINPLVWYVYTHRALVYNQLKQYEKAILDLDRATGLNPNDEGNYLARGTAHYFLRGYSKAIFDLDKALELNPDRASTYRYRGRTYYALKQYKSAMADFQRAKELEPENPVKVLSRFGDTRAVSWRVLFLFTAACAILFFLTNPVKFGIVPRTFVRSSNQPLDSGLWLYLLAWFVPLGVILFGFGRLRPKDIGLDWRKLPFSLIFTVGAWLLFRWLEAADKAYKETKGTLTDLAISFAIYTIPFAILQLVIFWGFLFPQLYLKFEGRLRLLNTLTVSQTLFMAAQIPALAASGESRSDIIRDLGIFFLCGVVLALFQYNSDNLTFYIGLSAVGLTIAPLLGVNISQIAILVLIFVIIFLFWFQMPKPHANLIIINNPLDRDKPTTLSKTASAVLLLILALGCGLAVALVSIATSRFSLTPIAVIFPAAWAALWYPVLRETTKLLRHSPSQQTSS